MSRSISMQFPPRRLVALAKARDALLAETLLTRLAPHEKSTKARTILAKTHSARARSSVRQYGVLWLLRSRQFQCFLYSASQFFTIPLRLRRVSKERKKK